MMVSAVIVTYNRRNYIRRALDSLFAQTVPVDEVIVVDDVRSTDRIEDAIKEWYGSRVRVVKEGGGLSGARRRGVVEASGEWIAFLDSDDDWYPDRNHKLLEAAKQVPQDVAWIFGDMREVTDAGDANTLFGLYGLSVTESPQIFSDSMSVQYPFQFGLLQGSFIRRSALLELDCFNEGLQSSEDLLVGFQIACRYKFAAIPAIVGRYFRTSDLASTSASVAGVFGPDYYRARMLSFALAIESGRRGAWNRLYAQQVSGLCRVLAPLGPVPRRLALQQFHYGTVSLKGLAFAGFAMLGRHGILAWNALAAFRKKLANRKKSQAAVKTSLHAKAGSARAS
jgi:glycosyltransferase involved in cell wall biosynthesis